MQTYPDPAITDLTTSLPGRPCSIAAALRVIGDRWALLVIRELVFGNHRFDQIATNTGAPRDRLAARLRQLEAVNLVSRRRYQDRPERYEYHLTQAGRELGPVLQAMRRWGDKWAVPAPPMTFRHRCGHEFTPPARCPGCGEQIRDTDMIIESLSAEWGISGPTSDYPPA